MNKPELPFSPSCERNKTPILETLRKVLPGKGTVLEIGSATGQHAVHFAKNLPGIVWQPSDRSEYLPGLIQRLQHESVDNIVAPLELDVLKDWPDGPFAAVYSSNTAHIMNWQAVCAMFEGVGKSLQPDGIFCLYGPFNENGSFTAPGNEAFDRRLREENPEMGVRDLEALESLGKRHQLKIMVRFQLPANNQLLVFAKESTD
jgi:SAM-dependent methyltransferase